MQVGGQYQQTCHSMKKWSSNYFQTCHNEDNLRSGRHVDLFPLAFLMNECIFLCSAVCNQRSDNGRSGGGIYHWQHPRATQWMPPTESQKDVIFVCQNALQQEEAFVLNYANKEFCCVAFLALSWPYKKRFGEIIADGFINEQRTGFSVLCCYCWQMNKPSFSLQALLCSLVDWCLYTAQKRLCVGTTSSHRNPWSWLCYTAEPTGLQIDARLPKFNLLVCLFIFSTFSTLDSHTSI